MNKQLLASITTLFVTLSLPTFGNDESVAPSQVEQNTPISFTGRVMGNKVRLRTGPNLESHILRDTTNGELLGVIGEKEDFYVVQAPHDIKGYVFRTFILDGVVEGDLVNIRLLPDVEAPIIGKLTRGQQIEAYPSQESAKWLEIDLPTTVPFYIAKEYVEKCGPLAMLSQIQQRKHEAQCHVNSVFHFAQSEMQKPFTEIDLDCVLQKFASVAKEYPDLPEVLKQTTELSTLMQDHFVQKKIAFLESKADGKVVENKLPTLQKPVELALAAIQTIGVGEFAAATPEKMKIWLPLEESIYHLWIASHVGSLKEFYSEEELNANIVTGVLEAYTKPVKNRPGDFILKNQNLPIAFLYSTRVDLEEMVGKKVTLKVASRPNNNFAFPAYFVLSVE